MEPVNTVNSNKNRLLIYPCTKHPTFDSMFGLNGNNRKIISVLIWKVE